MATPAPTQTPIPTPTPTPTPTPPLQSNPKLTSARKLPIKRKNPLLPPDPTTPLDSPNPLSDVPDDASFDDDEADDDETAAGEEDSRSPPFKFHRIWSESDEIRFLQGLLGCWSQGLVFPRDLNLFYDQFSESMPQPYTRSQLSEKLRRLRKKFRVMSGRVARGQDPSRLAPHDRDLLHLCTRLWHPSYASSSPFSSPDVAAPGGGGNKRRRPNPRAPSARPRLDANPPVTPPPSLPPITNNNTTTPTEEKPLLNDTILVNSHPVPVKEEPFPVTAAGAAKEGHENLLARTVLDVFEQCLKELQLTLGDTSTASVDQNDISKRWRAQRVAELDVLARRMRLVLEDAVEH
ncbi:uncharacterized protein [Typha latifolia]|uniref:uncharacterized protein n=1 Tax=Typha latifolia TaxID=4733 RepID=UPI003C308D5A